VRCAELDCENTCVENPCAHEFEKCTTDNEPSWFYSRKVSESNSWGVTYSRLDSGHSWYPSNRRVGDWLQIDLGKPCLIAGVVTQGRHGQTYQRVTEYTVELSLDALVWISLNVTFDAHSERADISDHVVNLFSKGHLARYAKITIEGYDEHPAMRANVLTYTGAHPGAVCSLGDCTAALNGSDHVVDLGVASFSACPTKSKSLSFSYAFRQGNMQDFTIEYTSGSSGMNWRLEDVWLRETSGHKTSHALFKQNFGIASHWSYFTDFLIHHGQHVDYAGITFNWIDKQNYMQYRIYDPGRTLNNGLYGRGELRQCVENVCHTLTQNSAYNFYNNNGVRRFGVVVAGSRIEMYYNFDLVMTYDVLLNTPQGWVAQYPSTQGNSIVAWEPHDVAYGPRQIGFFSHDSDGHGVYYRSPSLEIDALCTFTCPPAYRKLSSTSQVTCPAGYLKLDDGASHAFCVERRCNDTSGTTSFVLFFFLL